MWQAYPSHASYYPLVGFIFGHAKWLLSLDGLVGYISYMGWFGFSLMWALNYMGGDYQVGFVNYMGGD